jgi:hypothetical protein
MRTIFTVFGLAGTLLVSARVAEGCGDKIVSLLSPVLYQRAFQAAIRANVLIVVNTKPSGTLLGNPRLPAALQSVGHTVFVARNRAELQQVLTTQRLDVVLADASDEQDIARELSGPNKPVMVPVLYKPSAAARKQYPSAVRSSGDEMPLLPAIQKAMKSRAKL